MPLVEVPNQGTVEFPDTMSDSEIEAAIRENYSDFSPPRFDPEKGPPDFGPESPRAQRESAEIDQAQAHPLTSPIARPFRGALNLGARMGHAVTGMPGEAPTIEDIASAPESGKATQVVAGAAKAVADLGDFFTSPLGVATLGVGSLPVAAQRTVALAFATHMGIQTPKIASDLGAEIGKPEDERDYGKISELVVSGAANTALAATAGAKAIAPKPKSPIEIEADRIKPVAPLTAEALKDSAAPISGKSVEVPRTEEAVTEPITSPTPDVVKPVEEIAPAAEPVAPAETAPGAFPKSKITVLSDSIKDMAIDAPKETKMSEVFDVSQSTAGIKESVESVTQGLKAAGSYLKEKLINKPVWTEYKDALGQRHLELSESAHNAKKFSKISEKSVPSKLNQEAISDYIDTGGDPAVLDRAAAETKGIYRAGYEAAKNLSPEHKAIAGEIKQYFEARLEEAREAGILEDGIEDYIHRTYEAESPWKQGILAELRSGVNTATPALAKKRVFEYDFEAEQAGLKPIKSFIKRVAAYDLSLNKAMADRKLVKSMMEIKMPDGRPMIDVGGIGIPIEGKSGTTDATLIKPHFKPEDTQSPKNNRGDYKPYDYPALRKWKWVAKDAEGKPIFVQGDVLIHPEAMKKVRSLFERSAIRQNPIGRGALALSSTVKQTMLDLSGFHLAQITVHGWEHRSFKPVREIDFTDPNVRGLVKGGLQVGDTRGYEMFSEGLAGSSLTKHIPGIGPKLQAWNEWLFNSYIPRLKVSTGLHALERNKQRFPNLTPEEVNHLTANQMNAAFGELNYEMLGRSKTMQDALRLSLLAPDFLEARGRFATQAGTKYGREQLTALMLGAATMYVTARIINKLLNDSYHMEAKNAFSIVHDGKAYSLRTVQGDLLHLAAEPGRFFYNRLNPVYGRTGFEFLTGRDAFGRKRDFGEQVQDFATTIVPISLRGLLNPTEQTLMESMLNAFGITERRSSAISTIAELAREFKEKNKIGSQPGEFIYDPDKDPYRPIRQSAIFLEPEDVAKQIDKVVSEGTLTRNQIREHFMRYAQSPFTGTRKNDAAFVKSLTDDQKKLYQDAVKEKRELLKKFNAGYQIYIRDNPTRKPKEQP